MSSDVRQQYPNGCNPNGEECQACVTRTAEAVTALTAARSAEWAVSAFRRLYTYAACRQMEHSFVWTCMRSQGSAGLVQINHAA
jgi:hypothetical protein